ncbi:helix-turn-helix domain-containing protein [Kitasatospora sp. NBC_01287]|uniref:helix-turn-helix domain-containing protein n=1 Tax=Kitasatospora sp. NBC_01287 TaxID=2903573 RepID=UPI002259AD0F|nr:helix-turn-helix transcriptional regulator [Kitasatospora sp. NBC_01287]MCX4749576.1 helix-turn-helix domain-containing protein [Kitasatospora sp. NBC_01287]
MRRRRLGLELRAVREAKGLKGDETARRLKWAASKLSRIERGHIAPTLADVVKLLDLYGVGDQSRRDELTVLTKEARKKGWWQLYSDIPYSTYIGLEAEASEMLTYQHVVPGLFQTEKYAEVINKSTVPGMTEEALEQRVEVRIARQAILTRPSPMEVRAVLDESALRRMVGGPVVMREQLEQLLKLTELPSVLMQVIPFSAGGHPGTLVGPFVILRYQDPADPAVLYVEGNADPYLDREGEVERFTKTFDVLRASALSVDHTRALIRKLVTEL